MIIVRNSFFAAKPILSVVAIAALFLTASCGKSSSSGPATFAESDWSRRTMTDVSIDAPFALGAGPDITANLPKEVKDLTNYIQTYQGEVGKDSFMIMVSRIAYKPQVKPDLDGALRGAMTNAAAKLGDTSPTYTTDSTTISGMPALTSKYQHNVSGKTIHLDATIASRGPKMWQVQVIYFNDANAPDAARVLRSIAITP